MKNIFLLLILLVSACSGRNESEILSLLDKSMTEIPLINSSQTPIIQTELSDGDFLMVSGNQSVRIMNYNINWDSIFPDDDIQNMSYREVNRQEEFGRLVNAINPDIICLQEINPRREASQVSDILINVTGDLNWKAVIERDSLIATRFDFIQGYDFEIGDFPPNLPQAIAMIDLPDERFGETDLFAICAHFKAAGTSADIKLRQRQADILLNRIGDGMKPGSAIDLPLNTPFLLMGDFNIYNTDPAYHLVTLLTGDIIDEERYGTDVSPDWDGTDLGDVYPSVNNAGIVFDTWRDDGSPYTPGALDRIIYTDSLLNVMNSFILDTTLLSDEALLKFGLEFGDVLFASELGNYDHLPLVVDFELIN